MKLEFRKHTPVDRSDPGFTIAGKTLRWLSGKVSENNPGRPWVILRKTDLSKDVLDHIERHHPGAFAHGDTVRRGELVLGYSGDEVLKDYRSEIRQKAIDLDRSISRAPDIKDNRGQQRVKVEINESEDVTERMIQQFKTSKS